MEKGNNYRIVRHFTQWPYGSGKRVLAENLTFDAALEMKRKKSLALETVDIFIEEMD